MKKQMLCTVLGMVMALTLFSITVFARNFESTTVSNTQLREYGSLKSMDVTNELMQSSNDPVTIMQHPVFDYGNDTTVVTGRDTLEANPTWGSYVFDGWYTARTGGIKITRYYAPGTTYYAHWKISNVAGANTVLTEGIKIINSRIYIGDTEQNPSTLALYGIKFTPATDNGHDTLKLDNAEINGTVLMKFGNDDRYVSIGSANDIDIVIKGTSKITSRIPAKSVAYDNSGIFTTASLDISAKNDNAKLMINTTSVSNHESDGVHVHVTFTNSATLDINGGNFGVNVNKIVNSGIIIAQGFEYGVKVVGGDSGSNTGYIDATNGKSPKYNASGMYVIGNFTNTGNIRAVGSSNSSGIDIPLSDDDFVFYNNGTIYAEGGLVGIASYEGFNVGPDSNITAKTYLPVTLTWPAVAMWGLPLKIDSALTMEGSINCWPNEGDLQPLHINHGTLFLPNNWSKPVYVRIRHIISDGIFVNGEMFSNYKDTIVCGEGTAKLTRPENEGDPYVLTLDNTTITKCSTNDTLRANYQNMCGIYSEHDLKIVLKGENTIIPASGTKVNVYNSGIHTEKDLTIEPLDENASLSVATADAEGYVGPSTGDRSYTTGIGIGGDFVNEANITIICGKAQAGSDGISVYGTLTNNGFIDVTAGNVTDENGISSGIYLTSETANLVNNDELIATGGAVSGDGGMSYGIYGADEYHPITITNNGRMTATGGNVSENRGTSSDIFIRNGKVVNNSTLIVSAGSITEHKIIAEGYGIYIK